MLSAGGPISREPSAGVLEVLPKDHVATEVDGVDILNCFVSENYEDAQKVSVVN